MQKNSEKTFALILLGALLVFFVIISLLSAGVYGGADNYVHYRIAKYSFRHPEFFLDWWGKPVFTAASALFAQYGFNGIKIFNILTALLTAYFTFRISQKLNYRFPLLAVVILFGMPLYFIMAMTSLTEILFSFFLMLSAWLFLEKRYFRFAAVVSFIPFVRTEGFFLLPVFALALLSEKKIKAVPLLLTGTIFYSVIGSFYFRDLFWVFNQLPYVGGNNIYGSGPLLHFINSYKEITGLLPGLLLICGILILIAQSFQKRKENNFLSYEWLLLFLPFFIYLSLHSYLWQQGLGSSFGMTRVMAGVLPFASLLCLKSINFIYEKLPSKFYVRNIAAAVLIIFIAREPFIRNRIPFPLTGAQAVVSSASQWLKQTEYFKKKIYYYDPSFCFFLDVNPFDKSGVQEQVPDSGHPESGIAPGEIVIWDAHFAPNEAHLPLERMTGNSHFTLIKKFLPAEHFKVLGGNDFAVYVFRKNEE